MKLLVVALCAVLSSADRLENTYLPPTGAQSAGGSGNFLSTPRGSHGFGPKGVPGVGGFGPAGTAGFGPVGGVGVNGKLGFGGAINRPFPAVPAGHPSFGPGGYRTGGQYPAGHEIPILKYNNENFGDGNYHYAYETANGISAQEAGQQKNLGNELANDVRGDFSYVGDDGQQYSVSYIADENGFQPQGAHLPTPPPIPEAILRSLEQNAAEEARNPHRGNDDGSYYDDGARAGYPTGPNGGPHGFGPHPGAPGVFGGPGVFRGHPANRGPFTGPFGRPTSDSFGLNTGSRQYIPPNKQGFNPHTGYNY